VTPLQAAHASNKEKNEHHKQLSKRDNVHQRPPGVTQHFKNNDSINVIKSIFNIDLHHGPIQVQVKEGSNAKKDGLITSRVKTPN
jgi:hypothetical protein